MGKEKRHFYCHKILSPMACLPLLGAIYIWWNVKQIYIKSDFKAISFKPVTNGQSDKGFLLTSKVCPQVVVCICPGTIYIYKIIKNVYKIRFLFFFFFLLATNGQSDKGFLLTPKVCSQGVVCPCCPGAIYMYKIIKMCIKSDFEHMGKEERPFCCHQNCVPNVFSAPARGYIQVEKHEKACRDCFKTCNKWAKW